MKKSTIVLSVLLHGGAALAVLNAARPGALRKSFSVQMTEQAKKKAPPPKPATPKPQPPKPRAAGPAETPKPAANAPTPRMAEAPVARAAATAPVALDNIEMSNGGDDSPGGVVIPVARAAAAAPAGTRVASMRPDAPRRPKHELGAGPQLDENCHEEPTKPEPVFKTEIEYTHAARAEGIEGKLKLRVTVAGDGSVANVEVLSSVSPELDAAAVAAVRQWRFKPAMACGKPVNGGMYIIARRFELGD